VATISKEVQEREHEVSGYIEGYADVFDLDPNLVRALITQESRFVAEATSPTGAYGYGQFTGIGAKQVQNIANMMPEAVDLGYFTKRDADDPDKGIKAIYATLWWLFNKKYPNIEDKKVQLEAVLTFYNGGGRPAALVIKHRGHDKALSHLKELPSNIRSQSLEYAPSVAEWYVAWHEFKKEEEASLNPFDDLPQAMNPTHLALVQAFKAVADTDPSVDIIIDSRNGLTEVTLIFPGEFS